MDIFLVSGTNFHKLGGSFIVIVIFDNWWQLYALLALPYSMEGRQRCLEIPSVTCLGLCLSEETVNRFSSFSKNS